MSLRLPGLPGKKADMPLHILEKPAATTPNCKIWRDRLPRVFKTRKKTILAAAPDAKRAGRDARLSCLFPFQAAGEGRVGFSGGTANPPLALQAIRNDPRFWMAELCRIAAENPGDDVEGICWQTRLDVLRRSAALIQPVYEASDGRNGNVSGQVDPRLANDFDLMLAQGLELATLGRNLMVSIPGSAEGCRVIEELTTRGIPTHATTSFTLWQYQACMDAVTRGLDWARAAGIDLSRWRSVIPRMSARPGNLGDLTAQTGRRGVTLTPEEILHGEMAVLGRACHHGKAIGHLGKMLQGSLRVIDQGEGSKASSWHIEKIAGGDPGCTCPPGRIAQLTQAGDRLPEFDPFAIDGEPQAGVIARLRQRPCFRQARDFTGMKPKGVGSFGAFAATATGFAAAARKTVDFVARALESARSCAA